MISLKTGLAVKFRKKQGHRNCRDDAKWHAGTIKRLDVKGNLVVLQLPSFKSPKFLHSETFRYLNLSDTEFKL